MDIDKLLVSEIKNELEGLSDLEIGSDDHKKAVDDLTKLMDRAIELEKLDVQEKEHAEKRRDAEAELNFKKKQAEVEREFRQRQLDEEQSDRFVRNCVATAGVVVPAVLVIWGTLKSFEFEKEGTITTAIGRGFINKLLPKW